MYTDDKRFQAFTYKRRPERTSKRMKRITLSLPDCLAAALQREAHRRRVPVSRIAREAIEARISRPSAGPRRLPFASLGQSGHHSTARDLEAILAAALADDRDC